MSNINLTYLVNTFTDDLYNWAYYKTSNIDIAKDLVQDTFLVASEKNKGFQNKSSHKSWLFAILNNKIVDYYRKKIRVESNFDNLGNYFNDTGDWSSKSKPLDWGESESKLSESVEFQEALAICLNELPEIWNACINLKFLSSKSGDEICQELEISSSNYWQIIRRAKLQLRKCIVINWIKD